MIAAQRPLAAVSVAVLGAGVLAASSATAPAALDLPRLAAPPISLQASVLDIFTFPAWQQAIANEVEFLAIRAGGLAAASAGFAESVAQLPPTVLTAIQQVLGGDALAALTTVEQWVLTAAEDTLVPPVVANIDVGQIQLAIQSALLLAEPQAAVQLGSALFSASDTVARAVITAGQNLIDAVVSLNPAAIVQAVIGGATDVLASVGVAGQAVVDGVVDAQNTLAAALAARPAPTALAARPAPTALAAASDPADGSDPGATSARAAVEADPADSPDPTTAPSTAHPSPAADGGGVQRRGTPQRTGATTARPGGPDAGADSGADSAGPKSADRRSARSQTAG